MRSQRTRQNYASILRRFIALYDPAAVTRRDIEDFIHTGNHATATINARLSALSSFYKYATTYIPPGATDPLWQRANPATGIIRGKPERAPKGLSLEELQRLFAVIRADTLIGIRDRAVLLCVFWTARRRSEIADLLYGDIQPAAFPNGRGGMRKGYVYAFRGKGKKAVRDIQELPAPAKEAIDEYLEASGRLSTIRPTDPLFTAIGRGEGKGGNVRPGEVRKLTAENMAKRMKIYAREAGIPGASLHSLRHAAAKARYESGSDIREIQHLLRHQNLSTTDVYLRSLVGQEDTGAALLPPEFRQL